jgi:hypothetical protein
MTFEPKGNLTAGALPAATPNPSTGISPLVLAIILVSTAATASITKGGTVIAIGIPIGGVFVLPPFPLPGYADFDPTQFSIGVTGFDVTYVVAT